MFQGSSAISAVDKIVGGDLRQRGLVDEKRRKPVRRRLRRAPRRTDRAIHRLRRLRRNITRSRHCCSALLHGSRSSRAAAMPSASMRAVSGAGRRPRIVCSASAMAPSRRAWRPRKLRGRGIERDFFAAFDLVGEERFDLVERDWRGEQDAALRRGAGHFGHGEERLARQRRGRIEIGAAAIGEQERAARRRGFWRCGRDRRARGVAPGDEHRRRRPSPTASSAHRFAIRARVFGAARAVAAETDRADAPGRRRRRRARARTGWRRSRRHAAPAPCRAASTTMRASRGGSGSAAARGPHR